MKCSGGTRTDRGCTIPLGTLSPGDLQKYRILKILKIAMKYKGTVRINFGNFNSRLVWYRLVMDSSRVQEHVSSFEMDGIHSHVFQYAKHAQSAQSDIATD